MADARRTLLLLAIAECERVGALGACSVLIALRDIREDERARADANGPDAFAESYARFAARIGVASRTVRTMVRDKRIP
jgi:hypothetical protein